ncbi:MAG TPA: alpha-glucan family phosphorylase, partial [Chloroflexia bacterium]|nr:alpha-glucan family phosphorylase [Chloroflexia bacterium]
LVRFDFPGRPAAARVWCAQVGRVPLYLLDTNLEENAPQDRDVTDYLYGGDRDTRIRQEITLGIGGVRALEALGIRPAVYHMNEGHSAFMGLERIRVLMAGQGLSFDEARLAASSGNLFTTHTPVPAGIDLFSPDLVDAYFGQYRHSLGLTREAFLGLGRLDGAAPDEPFSMGVLALRMSTRRNGVSLLHGEVSRRLWQSVWPDLPVAEVPIGSVTNGVHHLTWVSEEMSELYDRYLSLDWRTNPSSTETWGGVQEIPAEELWRSHERGREHLVGFARQRLRSQMARRGALSRELDMAIEALDPAALTIGFARRFATYKRASLLFHDLDRLKRLVLDRDRPVQLIFAGKAHPADLPGKELIREIVHTARSEDLRRSIVFIEDYDLTVARALVHGVDVWLTTPRRPLEASGTSGMKVALNGGLNMSVLDGWWAEAYRPEIGWAIGRGEEYGDPDLQDEVESRAIYDLLEEEVLPLFYDRGRDGLPRAWINRMKASLIELCPLFTTDRMMREYTEKYYLPLTRRFRALETAEFAATRELAEWGARVRGQWPAVRVESVEVPSLDGLRVGKAVPVTARLQLGDLRPDDVAVELYYGPLDAEQQIASGTVKRMELQGSREGGPYTYAAQIPTDSSGLFGLAIRVLPSNSNESDLYETGLLTWSS